MAPKLEGAGRKFVDVAKMVYDSFFFCFVGTFGLWRKLVGLFLYHDSLTYLKIPYLFSMTGWTLAIQKCEVGFFGVAIKAEPERQKV